MNLTGTPNFEYSLTDHLGNSRVTFDSSTGSGSPKQTDDYYPFGLEISQGTVPSLKNEYLFNKKEKQEETGNYDYGARQYDPFIVRWTSVDPLSESMRRFNVYNYGLGNPLRFIDRDGRGPTDVIIGGTDKQKALEELQKSVAGQLTLTMDANGKLGYTTVSGVAPDQNSNGLYSPANDANQLQKAIDDHSIMVNVDATNNHTTGSGNLFIGGAFEGNTVTPASTPGGTATVSAKQEINPTILGKADAPYGQSGANTLHEVTEAYQGAKISQAAGASSGASGTTGSVYSAAHAAATPQAGLIYQTVYDSNGTVIPPNFTGRFPGATKADFWVKPENKPSVIILPIP